MTKAEYKVFMGDVTNYIISKVGSSSDLSYSLDFYSLNLALDGVVGLGPLLFPPMAINLGSGATQIALILALTSPLILVLA